MNKPQEQLLMLIKATMIYPIVPTGWQRLKKIKNIQCGQGLRK